MCHAVKFNTEYMSEIMDGSNITNKHKMANDTYRYCLNKDDLAIGLGRQINSSDISKKALDLGVHSSAYPTVVSTLTDTTEAFRRVLAAWYNNEDRHYKAVVEKWHGDNTSQTPDQKIQHGTWEKYARQYFCVGVALGMAHAHPSKGDTVASCLVGGLKTVLNGAYPIQTNDLIQFYFPFETPYFDTDGRRKQTLTGGVNYDENFPLESDYKKSIANGGSQREIYHKKKMAKVSNGDNNNVFVPLIKPFLDMEKDMPRDGYRVFARALSNARAFEMVDIQIGRQSL